jgi:hypothetical protein
MRMDEKLPTLKLTTWGDTMLRLATVPYKLTSNMVENIVDERRCLDQILLQGFLENAVCCMILIMVATYFLL